MDHTKGFGNAKIKTAKRVFTPILFAVFFLSGVSTTFAFVTISVPQTVTVTAVVLPSATPTPTPTPTPVSSGGGGGGGSIGGGGGGGGYTAPAVPLPTPPAGNSVSFQGNTYAGSIVTLLRDGVVVQNVPVSLDGSFTITLTGLPSGTYNFALRALDESKKPLVLQTYTVTIAPGAQTVVNGIILSHEPQKGVVQNGQVDINNDGRINLLDFSILAYWFKRPNPPKNVDINHDGKVDLLDFSILAFYWTG